MAGDWIKVEKVTARKPEVLRLASILKIHPDHAFGLCVRFWFWCDDHMETCNAANVTGFEIDTLLDRPGFSDALAAVGWLKIEGDSLQVPNFERHLSKTAKRRGLTSIRVTEHRQKSNAFETPENRIGNGASVTEALPEKRREELGTNKDKSSKKRVFQIPELEEIISYCAELKTGIDPEAFFDHYSASGWKLSNGNAVKDWKACLRKWGRNPLNKKPTSRLPTPEEDALWNPIDGGLGYGA